jgi:hypothetical protein
MTRYAYLPALLAGLALGGAARAEDDAVPLGSDGCDHTMRRAGYPDEVSCLARPGNTPAFCGYYVGGACVCLGGPPGPCQGTFGWDYCCTCGFHHHVMLGWCTKCRYKGGSGAYKTDGPPVPNIFGGKLHPRPEHAAEHAEAPGHCEGPHHP